MKSILTLKEIATEINKELKYLKINNHKGLHDQVEAICARLLPYGEYIGWDVVISDTQAKRIWQEREHPIFKLERDFEKNKSCRFVNKGRLTNIRMVIPDKKMEDMYYAEVKAYIRLLVAEKEVKKSQELKVDCEEKLKNATERFAAALADLATAKARAPKITK